jgi:acyl-CoA synthetase (AMP-forming)/AMP-acid ligase II
MNGLAHVLERATLHHRHVRAIRDNAATMSFAQLAARVVRLAGALHARGLRPTDRVAILARNSFRYIEVNLACAHAGIILVPVNIRLAAREIDRILSRTDTRLVFRSLPLEAPGIDAVTWDDSDVPGSANGYERLIAAAKPLDRRCAASPTTLPRSSLRPAPPGSPRASA